MIYNSKRHTYKYECVVNRLSFRMNVVYANKYILPIRARMK